MATLQPRTINIKFQIPYKEVLPLLNQVINMFVEEDPVKFKHLRLLVNKNILPALKNFIEKDPNTAGNNFLVWLTANLSDADISQAKEAAKKSSPDKRHIDFIIYLIQLSLQNFLRSVMEGAQKEQEAEDKQSAAAKTSGEEMNDEYNIPKRLHHVITQLESEGYDVDQLSGDALPFLKKKWETFKGSPKEKYIEFVTFWIQNLADVQIMKKYDEQKKQGKSDYELFNFLIEMGFIKMISTLRQKAKDFSRLTPQQKAKIKKQAEAQIRTGDEKRNQIMAQQPHHKSFLAEKKKEDVAEAAASALIKEEEEEAAVAKAKATKKHLANLLKQQQKQQKQRRTEAASTIQAKIRSRQSRVQAQEATKMQAQEATKMQVQETQPEEKKEQGVAKGVETQIFVPDNVETIISRLVELYTYLHSTNLFKKERKIRGRKEGISLPYVKEMYENLKILAPRLEKKYGMQLIITGGFATHLFSPHYDTTDIDVTIRQGDHSIKNMRDIIKQEFSTIMDNKFIFVSNIPGRELLEEEVSSDTKPETIQTRMGAIPILDITFSRNPIDDTELEKIDGVYVYNPYRLIDNLLLATNNVSARIRAAGEAKKRGDKFESIYPEKVLSWFLQLQKLFYVEYPEFKDSLISRIESVKPVEGGRKKKTRRKKKTGMRTKRKTRNKRGGRKGPAESATKFSVGIKKTGNDGNTWVIIKNKNGVKRWQRTRETKKTKKSNKKITRKIFKSKKDKITVKILRALKKKYSVTITGNKKEMAEGLWVVRGGSISNDDLQKIIPLLSKRDKKEAEKLLSERFDDPITDYKGMWKPLPKPLSKMSRKELVKYLRRFRDVWERETTRNQDLSDERLNEESDKNLRGLLEFYFSDGAKQMAGDWLRK